MNPNYLKSDLDLIKKLIVLSEKVLYLTYVINYDKQEISFPIQIQIQKIFGKKRK